MADLDPIRRAQVQSFAASTGPLTRDPAVQADHQIRGLRSLKLETTARDLGQIASGLEQAAPDVIDPRWKRETLLVADLVHRFGSGTNLAEKLDPGRNLDVGKRYLLASLDRDLARGTLSGASRQALAILLRGAAQALRAEAHEARTQGLKDPYHAAIRFPEERAAVYSRFPAEARKQIDAGLARAERSAGRREVAKTILVGAGLVVLAAATAGIGSFAAAAYFAHKDNARQDQAVKVSSGLRAVGQESAARNEKVAARAEKTKFINNTSVVAAAYVGGASAGQIARAGLGAAGQHGLKAAAKEVGHEVLKEAAPEAGKEAIIVGGKNGAKHLSH